MGLDAVEMVMEVEISFGVAILDAEAVKCETPADIISLVLEKLQPREEPGCISQRGFYLLRRELMRSFTIERASVTLDLKIRSLDSERSDRAIWESLKAATEARSWPSLVRPRWLVVGLWLMTGGVLLALYQVTHPAIALAGALLAGCSGMLLTRRSENRIPPAYSRVRDLVPFAVTSEQISWSPDEIAAQVKKIVMEQLGVNEDQYRTDAHFVYDFGMD